jgi:hypothetical protein
MLAPEGIGRPRGNRVPGRDGLDSEIFRRPQLRPATEPWTRRPEPAPDSPSPVAKSEEPAPDPSNTPGALGHRSPDGVDVLT